MLRSPFESDKWTVLAARLREEGGEWSSPEERCRYAFNQLISGNACLSASPLKSRACPMHLLYNFFHMYLHLKYTIVFN